MYIHIYIYLSTHTLVDMETCLELYRQAPMNVQVLDESADKRSSTRPFAEGQQKRGHSSSNSNQFRNLSSNLRSIQRSRAVRLIGWGAEHQGVVCALPPRSLRHGKPVRIRAAAPLGSAAAAAARIRRDFPLESESLLSRFTS